MACLCNVRRTTAVCAGQHGRCFARRTRLGDCAAELRVLLQEEKLAGASLLVLANKQDLPGALPLEDIERVRGSANLLQAQIPDRL